MKEKLKTKLPDFLLTLLSSLIALFLLVKSNATVESYLLETLEVPKDRIALVIGTYFSLMVTLIFIIILSILTIIEKLLMFFSRPKVVITFYDKKGKIAHEIDFKESPGQPKYLKVALTTKFSSFQLYALKNLLQAKMLISLNPNMCAIELHNGFIGNSKYYKVVDGALECDIFSLFQASDEEQRLDIDLSLLLMNSAQGEVKANLSFSNSFSNLLLKRYCKFKVSTINLEG
ncbi:hypothetical protein MKY22_00860 [Exiguobacterium sp. FSL W8-0210]|uniref:hypothetical protein n=1 Tax=Exiguobacterium sp. FSL W8-0210 TaxID=2921598 RepID=UPI0030F6B9AA